MASRPDGGALVRRLPILGAAVLVAALLTACGPSGPKRVLSQPPAPPRTGAPRPFTQVDRPVNLAKFDSDPCSLLTKEQVAAAVTDPPNNVTPVRKYAPPASGCSWVNLRGATMSALRPVNAPTTLTELSAYRLDRHDRLEPWAETSIDGLPAVVYHMFRDMDECTVSIQVTEKQMLTFEIQGKDLPGSYWDKDRCGGVEKMAELVIGNLRQG